VLERFTSRVRHLWALVALVVLIGSLGGPLSGTGATTGASVLRLRYVTKVL